MSTNDNCPDWALHRRKTDYRKLITKDLFNEVESKGESSTKDQKNLLFKKKSRS